MTQTFEHAIRQAQEQVQRQQKRENEKNENKNRIYLFGKVFSFYKMLQKHGIEDVEVYIDASNEKKYFAAFQLGRQTLVIDYSNKAGYLNNDTFTPLRSLSFFSIQDFWLEAPKIIPENLGMQKININSKKVKDVMFYAKIQSLIEKNDVSLFIIYSNTGLFLLLFAVLHKLSIYPLLIWMVFTIAVSVIYLYGKKITSQPLWKILE